MIDYKKELNASQYKAITTTEGPLLFLAGAGVGKTRTLVYRVAYLLENHIDPERILLLTFTNKAAKEMKERIVSLVGEVGNRITACTYHSFCASWLRLYGDLVGLTNHFSIIDGSDMEEIIAMARTELGIKAERGFPRPATIAAIASSMINEELSLSQVLEKNRYERYQFYEPEIEAILEKAKEIKEQDHLANYDDLMVYFLQLLEEHDEIREKLEKQYQYIMIDEYQDTNNIQDNIVLNIRKKNHNIVVVGDDHQSLYAFRGANVENIIHFPQRFKDCQIIQLMDNYRSNQEILDLANHVIANYATEGFPKTLKAQFLKEKKPHHVLVSNTSKQTQKILSLIKDKHSMGIPYHEMAVLYRWGFESAEMEVALNTVKIPFVKYGGKKFLEKEHIKDLLAFLKIRLNPHDEISWFRILKIHEGIGNVYARQIAAECRIDGIDALSNTKYFKRKYYRDLLSLHQALQVSMSKEWTEFFSDFIDYYKETKRTDISTMKTSNENKDAMMEHLEDVITEDLNILLQLSSDYHTASEFLDDLNLDATGNTEDDGDTLVLSTVHSAKGLEFDTVFILDCVDEVFPSTRSSERGSKEDNEELRCFYVAITRAKNDLWLFSPEVIRKFNRPLYTSVSHYLTKAHSLLS